ncbi:MAG: DUF167 domain-containing protein [Deltaproteobacteria bacterium]|nr:DUF167 domain-containing protein [Deltaproteobacteria bacterium]
MVLFCREQGSVLSISLLVQPRARKTEIIGVHGEALKVKVAGLPINGAANEELVRFFAKFLDVSKSAVQLKQGSTGRKKVIEVKGLTTSELTAILLKHGLLTIRLG